MSSLGALRRRVSETPTILEVALAVVFAAMAGLGFVPLFDGPGYESSLGAGILLAFVVPITTSLLSARRTGAEEAPLALLSTGVASAACLAFAAWITTLAHGLRVGFCDLRGGTESFVLGPFAGALIAGVWGTVAGEIARGRRRPRLSAVVLAIAGPLATISFSVGRFYTSPMIFAYDPFVGYFSGTLYDTLISFSGLISYRAGSAATLLAAFIAAAHLERRDGRIRLVGRGHPGLVLVGFVAALASVVANIEGDRLGHWQTAATIAAKLGGRTDGKRCTVIHARSQRAEDVQRFVDDCDAHVATLERWFEGTGPERITAFLFESSAQKGALMGAADTYIAKPWRKEIYVQTGAYPHPVLGHELAHVVAGSFGQGPFRVAGALGGIVPNPGLVEGVAVAAEPPEGDLLPREWARAMKDLGILPKLDRLFNLGFLGQNASTAYTVSGAFVGWIHDHYGARAMTSWYGGRPLPEVVGVSWSELEAAWHQELGGEVVPATARGVAKARFDRPAIFGRRCPHIVDGCRARGDQLRGTGDAVGAIAAYRELLTLDPNDDGVRELIGRTELHDAALEAAGADDLARIAGDERAPRHIRDRAVEDLADRALAVDRPDDAARGYADVLSRTLDEDAKRTLEIKIEASRDADLRPAIVALLIGARRGHPAIPDRSMAMELLGRIAATHETDGMPWYLLARQYVTAGNYDDAAIRLDRALALPFRVLRVRIEAERLRMLAACALGDAASAQRLYQTYSAHPEVNASRRGAARALVARCTGRDAEAVDPAYATPGNARDGGAQP